ncbi:MAG: flagellar protein FlbB [Hyphomicrobiales bacterium]|nr:flagellar protein FlbB [Hyphomicrobiales bacterium]
MKAFRDIRILPVVLVAIFGLAILKIAGLVIDGGYVFEYQPQPAKQSDQQSWAQEMFNFPGGPKPIDPDITGSVSAKKDEPAKPAVGAPDAITVTNTPPVEQAPKMSDSERAILERLQSRRQELDARARELEIRESLLKSAEKRIESKVDEMKGVEAGIKSATGQKSEADAARFKGIVTMYESMKPKDAAKIFDRLEMPVLFEIASQIAPRKMSDILGLMLPEAAERLTVELARRAQGGERAAAAAELPKIEGRPVQPVRN